MEKQIAAIITELGIKAADKAVFVVDKPPTERTVYVYIDTAAGKWTAFDRKAAGAQYVITDGALVPA